MKKTTRKTLRDSRGRAHDVRTGKLISEKEALRRERISEYAKRRFRSDRGSYEKRRVRVRTSWRDRDSTKGTEDRVIGIDYSLHEDREVLANSEDFEDVRKSLDEEFGKEAHFGIEDVEVLDDEDEED